MASSTSVVATAMPSYLYIDQSLCTHYVISSVHGSLIHYLYAWTILFVYGLSSQCMNHPFSTYNPFHNWMKWHFECIKMHRWNLMFIKDYLWVYAAGPYAPYMSEWKCTFESWSCQPLCKFIKDYIWVYAREICPFHEWVKMHFWRLKYLRDLMRAPGPYVNHDVRQFEASWVTCCRQPLLEYQEWNSISIVYCDGKYE